MKSVLIVSEQQRKSRTKRRRLVWSISGRRRLLSDPLINWLLYCECLWRNKVCSYFWFSRSLWTFEMKMMLFKYTFMGWFCAVSYGLIVNSWIDDEKRVRQQSPAVGWIHPYGSCIVWKNGCYKSLVLIHTDDNSPVLSLENHMNFAFVVTFDFLAFCCVEPTKAHSLHHFHLFRCLSFQISLGYVNSTWNFGLRWRRLWWTRAVPPGSVIRAGSASRSNNYSRRWVNCDSGLSKLNQKVSEQKFQRWMLIHYGKSTVNEWWW